MINEVVSNKSPYKGLQPYTENDRDFFFGRERDHEIITSNLFASPLTIFYGASGVGKSSVLLAGVVPELRQSKRIAVVVFREWQDAGFEVALKREVLKSIKTDKIDPALELDEFLLECTKEFRGSLFFILDQFEEYFLYHPPSAQTERFDAAFARTINRSEIGANFLLSMRDDGLSRLDRFQRRIPNLLNNMLRLEHLDRASAELAIRSPLTKHNESRKDGELRAVIEDGLVAVLLEDLQTGKVTLDLTGQGKVGAKSRADRAGRIETPFLQLVLTRLWDEECHAAGSGGTDLTLRLATYQALGGAKTIVRTHLDKVMKTERLRPHRDAAAALFHFLVTPTGQKIAYTPADLASYAQWPPREIDAALTELSHPSTRILRPVAPPPDRPEMLRYEIFHDVLAPAILSWRTGYMEERSKIEATREVIKRVEHEFAEAQREAKERQQQLELAEARAEAERLRAEKQRRSAQQLKLGLVLVLLLLLAMFGVTAYAYSQRNEAQRQRIEADKAKVVAEGAEAEAGRQKDNADKNAKEAKTAKDEAIIKRKEAELSLAKALHSEQQALRSEKIARAERDRAQRAIKGQQIEQRRRRDVETTNEGLQDEVARLRNAENRTEASVNQTLDLSSVTAPTSVGPVTPANRIDGETLRRILPNLSPERSAELAPQLQRAMEEFGINSPLRQAAFIAQISHETDGMKLFVDNLSYSADALRRVFPKLFPTLEIAAMYARQPEKVGNRIYANKGGNGPEESGDGYRYRTRLMVFGRAAYRAYSQALRIDLEGNPDEASKPGVAFRIAGAYWESVGGNELADRGDFAGITRKITGGTSGQASREQYYAKAKEVLGVR